MGETQLETAPETHTRARLHSAPNTRASHLLVAGGSGASFAIEQHSNEASGAAALAVGQHSRWPPLDSSTNLTTISSSWAEQPSRGQHQQQVSSSDGSNFHYYYYGNHLNSVREMIAQHSIEFVLILVIITYLIYYFSKISRRPKLIGDPKSRLVNSVQRHMSQTLNKRFNPLIYFWGTNPQTCLFGYLQGQTTSDTEMPRSKFKRQYLYISDAQYLTSNVDLSAYYQQQQTNNKSHQLAASPKSAPLNSLELNSDLARPIASLGGRQLDENLRLALSGMLECQKHEQSTGATVAAAAESSAQQSGVKLSVATLGQSPRVKVVETRAPKLSASSASSASGCSSADSGVFNANGSNSGSVASRSSSASSLSEVSTGSGGAAGGGGGSGGDSTLGSSGTASASADDTDASSLGAGSSGCESEATKGASPTGECLRERLEFGQCALDWHLDSHRNYRERKQVALISAGMTTGSDKKYVTDTVKTLESLGYEVCVFIRRGVGGLALSSPKFFSPSKWRDFEAAVKSVRKQRPGARLVAVGFSFGSIELCRYLSMSGRESLVDAALLVSCPFDPEAGGRNMRRRALNRKIDAYLARNLGKQLHWALFDGRTSGGTAPLAAPAIDAKTSAGHQKQQQLVAPPTLTRFSNYNGSFINLNSLAKIKSLVEFEDDINRRLQNYPNSEAYANDSRLSDHLKLIETPTLCLSSEDDFMAPMRLLPVAQIEANPNLCMLLTKRGGHMAFIDGLFWPKRPYFAQRIIANYLSVVEELIGGPQCARPASVRVELGGARS